MFRTPNALPPPCGLGQPEQGTQVVALRTPLPAGPARGDPSNPLICLGKFAQANLKKGRRNSQHSGQQKKTPQTCEQTALLTASISDKGLRQKDLTHERRVGVENNRNCQKIALTSELGMPLDTSKKAQAEQSLGGHSPWHPPLPAQTASSTR